MASGPSTTCFMANLLLAYVRLDLVQTSLNFSIILSNLHIGSFFLSSLNTPMLDIEIQKDDCFSHFVQTLSIKHSYSGLEFSE